MKCIVKGCENEAVGNMLCPDHYDPEKKAAPAKASKPAHRGLASLETRLNLAAHTLFLISGKVTGKIVNGYNNLFTLTKGERAQIFEHVGTSGLKKGRKDSLTAFETAVQLDPTNAETHRKLGDAYVEVEKFDQACESYNKALELRPDYLEAYEALGHIYYDQANYDAALKCLTKARTLDAQNDRIAYLVGLTYDKLGLYDKAIKFVETAIDLNPREIKYYYSLGFICDSNGLKDKSVENFKKAVELEKGHAR